MSYFLLKKNYDISDVHRIVSIKFAKLISRILIKFIKGKIIYSSYTGGKTYKQRNSSDCLIMWSQMNKKMYLILFVQSPIHTLVHFLF